MGGLGGQRRLAVGDRCLCVVKGATRGDYMDINRKI